MKIIKLEILNLASLDNPNGEVIDFTRGALGDSNIFSIVGPTGSGKSTILDAICLALYGRAPRYPRQKGERNTLTVYGNGGNGGALSAKDPRNILTRGKKKGYSKLTFQANDGSIYRAEWHVQFKRTTFDEATKLLYKFEVVNGQQQELAVEWNDLTTIIGLEFEQFLRTVLIAQGSFANFITASETERKDLLEKLVGCGATYGAIAERIKACYDQAQTAYKEASMDIEHVAKDRLDDNVLAELKAQVEQQDAEMKKLSEFVTRCADQLRWFADDRELQQNLVQCQKDAEQVKQRLTDLSADLRRLELHDSILPATALLRDVRTLEANVLKADRDMETLKRQLEAQKDRIDAENKLFVDIEKHTEEAKKHLDEMAPVINKGRELVTRIDAESKNLSDKTAALKRAENELSSANKAVSDNRKAIDQAKRDEQSAEADWQKFVHEAEAQKTRLAEASKAADDALETEKKKVEGVDANDIMQQRNRFDKEYKTMELAEQQTARKEQLSGQLKSSAQRKEQLLATIADTDKMPKPEEVEEAEKVVRVLQDNLALMRSLNLEKLRHRLEDGKPCPLCGATSHPYVDSAALQHNISDVDGVLTTQRQELDRLKRLREEYLKKRMEAEGEMKAVEEHIRHTSTEIENCEKALAQLHAEMPIPDDREGIIGQKHRLQAELHKAEERLKLYNDVQTSIAHCTELKDKAHKAETEYERKANEQISILKERVTAVQKRLSEYSGLMPNLEEQQKSRTEAHALAVKDRENSQRQLDEMKQMLKDLLGDKLPDDLHRELTSAYDTALMDRDQKKKQIEVLKLDHGNSLGQLQSTQKTREELQAGYEAKQQALDAWITSYNARDDRQCLLTLATTAAILDATVDWESMRRTAEDIKRRVSSAEALLTEAYTKCSQHLVTKPEKEQPMISAEKQEAESRQQTLMKQFAESRVMLDNHDRAVRELGEKMQSLARLKADLEEWKLISDAIGSNGSTMRSIAQCYTLRFLVEYANVEIRRFNSRFELQHVDNSLGLRIIDHERGDDVREVTSLSGGETFVVSLGLALGLSSISSRNLAFDNLFVDEGFGTLDPTSLAVVIDALATLQSSAGKKVGVISHTDTMSERITTQIRVVRNGNSGSSHIDIWPQ